MFTINIQKRYQNFVRVLPLIIQDSTLYKKHPTAAERYARIIFLLGVLSLKNREVSAREFRETIYNLDKYYRDNKKLLHNDINNLKKYDYIDVIFRKEKVEDTEKTVAYYVLTEQGRRIFKELLDLATFKIKEFKESEIELSEEELKKLTRIDTQTKESIILLPYEKIDEDKLMSGGLEYYFTIYSNVLSLLYSTDPTLTAYVPPNKVHVYLELQHEDSNLPRIPITEGAWLLEGLLGGIKGQKLLNLGKIHVCTRGHVILSNTELQECPRCGSSFKRVEDYRVLVWEAIFHPRESLDTPTVYVPAHLWKLLYGGKGITWSRLIVTPVNSGKKQLNYIAIGADLRKSLVEIDYRPFESRIRELSQQPTWKILKTLMDIAYKEYRGLYHVKLALLFSVFSAGLEKVPLPKKDYGPIHTLIIGPPGTAKSRLARATIEAFAPETLKEIMYFSGDNVSKKGLTFAYDSVRKIHRVGPLVQSHGNFFILDELDKADNILDVIKTLNPVMSDHKATSAKAGESISAEVVTPLILIGNIPSASEDNPEYFQDITTFRDFIVQNFFGSRKEEQKRIIDAFLDRIDLLVAVTEKIDILKALQYFSTIVLEDHEEEELDTNFTKALYQYLKEMFDGKVFACPRDDVIMFTQFMNSVVTEYQESTVVQALLTKSRSGFRELNTIMKMAKVIAKLHLRDIITFNDLKEALAFYIYIHSVPFRAKEQDKRLLQLFKSELGFFYDIFEKAVSSGTRSLDVAGIAPPIQEVLIITNEDEAKNLVLMAVGEIEKKKGEATVDDVYNILRQWHALKKFKLQPKKKGAKWHRIFTMILYGEEEAGKNGVEEFLEKLYYEGVLMRGKTGYKLVQ